MTRTTERTKISRTVTFECTHQTASNGGVLRVPVTLRFNSVAPHEVTFTFRVRPSRTWIISRDLLIDGMAHDAGAGDVRIMPDAPGWIALGLRSPDGVASFRMWREDLTQFLSDTASADDFLSDLEQWMMEATP